MGGDGTVAEGPVRHPAKFTAHMMHRIEDRLADMLRRGALILDPFAGTGGVHLLHDRPFENWQTFGVELEPEWALQHDRTIVGSALELPFPDRTFDAIVTSPCYGNRMADHHEAKDGSMRNTYRHALSRVLSSDNSGGLQWGPAYREFHRRAWDDAARVLRPGGLVVLNVGNHIRKSVEQFVAEFHLADWCQRHEARVESVERIRTPGLRYGANHDLRVGSELLMIVRVP